MSGRDPHIPPDVARSGALPGNDVLSGAELDGAVAASSAISRRIDHPAALDEPLDRRRTSDPQNWGYLRDRAGSYGVDIQRTRG